MSEQSGQSQAGRAKRRRFWALLLWNALGTLALGLPLFFYLLPRTDAAAALLISATFSALLLLMGAVLAGYFAYLRTG